MTIKVRDMADEVNFRNAVSVLQGARKPCGGAGLHDRGSCRDRGRSAHEFGAACPRSPRGAALGLLAPMFLSAALTI
jgi:hypothetical protein